MKTQITEKLIIMRERSGLSYETLSEKTHFSKSTLHRWFSGEAAPSVDDLPVLVEAMDGDITEIYASVARQEMVATQNLDYEGATTMVARYETEISALRERLALINDHHDREIANMRDHYEHNIQLLDDAHALALDRRDQTYDRSVSYLKERVEKLDERAAAAEARLRELDARRHNVFWGMLIVIVLLIALLVLAVVIDAPQIGLGWPEATPSPSSSTPDPDSMLSWLSGILRIPS